MIRKVVYAVALFCFLTACKSVKEIVYVQDIDHVQLHEITTRYEARIKKDDLLNIVVSAPDKQVVMPYNLTLSDFSTGGGGFDSERVTLPYLVDINGEIDFPILGKIKVEGMTRSDLADYLTSVISKDVKNPIVYVSFRNYKITVLGEVKNPGTYSMDSEKVNIFQALGKAGDLSLTAKREDIILIREVGGVNTHYRIDLKSANLMNEDFFYMQQNDVLYVPPSGQRISEATTNTGIWSVLLSSVASVLAVVTLITK
ncbi:MAG: polysaccharide biosynthesis/export family protein [Bacteroidales bacterium]|nr:polysaccharide biosynthesis/export family protein [Bacteroidales bacterium]